MTFHLGCAIWSYKDWVGDLFPAGSRSRDFLSLYSRRFTTVEGNTTFYAVPDAATVRRWKAETPDEFKFCLKLPRDISHQRSLMPQLAAAQQFFDRVSLLESRLGLLFLQLPPHYSPAQFDDLARFLQAWRPNVKLAVEVRHPDWFTAAQIEKLDRLLRELNVGRVLLDSRPIYQEAKTQFDTVPGALRDRRKPKLPLLPGLTADFTLIRYVSHPDRAKNAAFLTEWATHLQTWLPSTQIYFCVHCPIEVQSPTNAHFVQQVLEEQGVSVPRLPWDAIEQTAQLDLF
ncbi:DUF72 domain-containing protein [Microcoleus sp. FACHB-1515]|uniref:DUF72 domain-containing protein n=1 Tax=Cyanophyceae TaxID=3028117 RepID=UPI0016850679|nr:DUF72 domain-containing protein [Microcoleus sp. FACHB-1515]MBD2088375.1 DUF72 domain-containing protein [Microcoleus sp. FACHB-1515]